MKSLWRIRRLVNAATWSMLFFGVGVLAGIFLLAMLPGMPWVSIVRDVAEPTSHDALDLGAQRSMANAAWYMVVVSGASGAVATVSLFLLFRTLRETQRTADAALKDAESTRLSLALAAKAEIATRFQKGVELLESHSEATVLGGLTILRDVAREAAEDYWLAICDVLVAFITDSCKDVRQQVEFHVSMESEENAFPVPSTRPRVKRALEILGLADLGLRAAVYKFTDRNRILIEGVALVNVRLAGLDLANVWFSDAYLLNGSFNDCILATATFHADQAVFRRCTILPKAIVTVNSITRLEAQPQERRYIYFERCQMREATALTNGVQLECVNCDVTAARISSSYSIRLETSWYFGDAPTINAYNRAITWLDVLDVSGAEPVQAYPDGWRDYRHQVFDL
jgi:hypothetical protein